MGVHDLLQVKLSFFTYSYNCSLNPIISPNPVNISWQYTRVQNRSLFLRYMNPAYFFNISFNIILPSKPWACGLTNHHWANVRLVLLQIRNIEVKVVGWTISHLSQRDQFVFPLSTWSGTFTRSVCWSSKFIFHPFYSDNPYLNIIRYSIVNKEWCAGAATWPPYQETLHDDILQSESRSLRG
jgi:hypothetical protein